MLLGFMLQLLREGFVIESMGMPLLASLEKCNCSLYIQNHMGPQLQT